MSEPAKEECLIPIDWDSMWAEAAAKHDSKYERSKAVVSSTEQIITKYINISINNIISNTTISNNTKLEVIKELYMKRSVQGGTLSVSYYSRALSVLTGMLETESKDIVTAWQKEYRAKNL